MRAPAASGLLALILATACAGIGDLFREPEIRLDRVVLKGLSGTGGDLDLIVQVENPNGFTLHGTRLELGVDVEGSHLGDISYDDDFSVSENGITTVTLPLKFGWAGVGSAVRTALGYGELPYKMQGQVELRTPWGRKEVPFTHEGRVPLIRSGGVIAIPGHTP